MNKKKDAYSPRAMHSVYRLAFCFLIYLNLKKLSEKIAEIKEFSLNKLPQEKEFRQESYNLPPFQATNKKIIQIPINAALQKRVELTKKLFKQVWA